MESRSSARLESWVLNGFCITENGIRTLDIGIRDGKIHELLASGSGPRYATTMIDASGSLVIPGFVNSHTHSPDNITRGSAPDLPLELWSLVTSQGRDRRLPREMYVSAMIGCIDLLRSGSTTVLDHIRFNPDIDPEGIAAVCAAYRDAGIRAVVAPIVADRPVTATLPLDDEDFEGVERPAPSIQGMPAKEQARIVEDFLRRTLANRSLVAPAIAPSGPQRCSDELLSLCAELSARHKVPLHTHLLETKVQSEMAKRLYGGSMVSHIAALGLVTSRSSFAHVVCASPEDLDVLASAGASVVHNPVSNTRLGGGVADVPAMLERGINVALGTDSGACNDSNNMLETMKFAAILHNLSSRDPSRWVGPERALAMATSGGARALSLNTGKIELGYAADLSVVNLNQPAFVPLNDAVRQLVLGGAGMVTDTVLVNGRVVVANGKCVLIDEKSIWAEAREFAIRRKAAESPLKIPVTRMYQRIHGLRR